MSWQRLREDREVAFDKTVEVIFLDYLGKEEVNFNANCMEKSLKVLSGRLW